MINQLPQSPTSQTSLLGVTTILGQAWSLYKQRLWIFLGIMIIPTLVFVGLLLVLMGGIFLGFPLFSFLFGIVFFLAIFIGGTWGQTALLYAIKDSQEKIGIVEAYRRGWSKILSYWWVLLLLMFIVIGGTFLFIIPGIIFAIWFSFSLYILIAEDLKGMDALLKSKEYVKGKWGSVFWRLFFIGILSTIIYLVPDIIFSILEIPYIQEISDFIIWLFLTPLITTYSFLLYSNLKAVRGEIAFATTRGKKAIFIFIGILGILVIPAMLILSASLKVAREKGGDALRRESDFQQIQAGLKIYYDEKGSYPFSLNELVPQYLPITPIDQSTNQPYQYQLQSDGTDYKVCAELKYSKSQKCVTSQF